MDPYWEALAKDIDTALRERYIHKRLNLLVQSLQYLMVSILPQEARARITSVLDITAIGCEIQEEVFCPASFLRSLASLLQFLSRCDRERYSTEVIHNLRDGESQSSEVIAYKLREFLEVSVEIYFARDEAYLSDARRELMNGSIKVLQCFLSGALEPVEVHNSREWYRNVLYRHHNPRLTVSDLAREHLSFLWAESRAQLPETLDITRHYLRDLWIAFHFSIDLELRCRMLENTGNTVDRLTTYQASEDFFLAIFECSEQEDDKSKSNACGNALKVTQEALDSSTSSATQQKSDCPRYLVPFADIIQSLRQQLEEATLGYIGYYITLSPFETYQARTGMPTNTSFFRYSCTDQVARRVAQLTVLHFHVWGDTFLMGPDDRDVGSFSSR
ncbi:hypothetical protein BDV32DRAFT_152955 [Aspergillus pseudonomiae]|uniref:Uncharacterized protein n=1 Tax=Aspergillus pseudonomiae TaxID=1506151 RepID=A0A5N7CSH7_9EURO|nr:uncharacterized protein BDV37DRAFT_289897 [Aspergillus pseudonomiae]KAB8256803.1 hypothetical protein BDV32DRAFT_152955 [Aspergillus pseudonomiae]KAE8396889.1 hypothetical protein BDV37DRAFT_289897 [Aspergillus pseudonomiae]